MKAKSISIACLAVVVALLFGFRQSTHSGKTEITKGMIKVTILYPNGEGKKFDIDYYSQKHMPMIAGLFGDSLKSYGIEKGLSGRTPADPTPYLAIGYFYFDHLSAYQNSFKANAEKIRNDIPNYTNVQPVVQISEIIR